MRNLVNKMVVRELTEAFESAEGMVVVSFGGLSVSESESLRGNVAEKGAQMRMVRNRLARKVLADRGIEIDADALSGNTAIAWGSTEETIGAAKVFADKEVKKAGKVEIRAGLLEGEGLDATSAKQLADIPDRDTINAQLLGVISGPARSLATILAAVPSSVARVMQARVDEGGGASDSES